MGWVVRRDFALDNCRTVGTYEVQFRRGGQGSDLSRIAIEQVQALQARGVQVVVNVIREVGTHSALFKVEAGSPFARDSIET